MGIAVKISFQSGDVLNAEIDRISGALEDFTPIWKKLRPVFAQGFAQNFASQSGLVGAWPPLNPQYLIRKTKAGYPADILVRTGGLRNAYLQVGESPTPNQIMIDEPLYFAFGVMNEVGFLSNIHDQGLGNMPKREHSTLPKQVWDKMIHVIATETYKLVGRV